MSEWHRIAALKAASQARLGGQPETFETPYVVLASPGWRGVEADVFLARHGERSELIKAYRPETAFFIDLPTTLDAARAAGDLGVGPQVIAQDTQSGVLVMDYLGEGWRVAGLHDAWDARIRAEIIAAKKRFQSGPGCIAGADTFGQIHFLANIVRGMGLLCPPQLPAWLGFIDEMAARIGASGTDRRPCHRDGNISNVMIGPEGAVRLLDYDLAANADPFEDVGCYLTEMHDGEPGARAGFEEWMGYFREDEFRRAMSYGIADDLRWGLIGIVMTGRSPRRDLEYSKYASWRLMRFEDNMSAAARSGALRTMA